MVKRKYFKSPLLPNFLTWAEKEQIRFLHRSDPGDWTSDKLAHSFPASETVIKKIIKARWEAGELKDIQRHDQAVEANWRALFSGDLQLESDLKMHLLKFAKREQATLAHNFMAQLDSSNRTSSWSSNKSGEFSAIIESYDRERGNVEQKVGLENRLLQVDVDKTAKMNRRSGSNTNIETYVLDDDQVGKTNKHLTLEQYRQDFNLNTTNETEKLSLTPSSNLQSIERTLVSGGSKKTKQNIALKHNEKSSVMDSKASFSSYPENIVIPVNKWKEGGTFKMGDCYYDDDGEFLYRVPGMK